MCAERHDNTVAHNDHFQNTLNSVCSFTGRIEFIGQLENVVKQVKFEVSHVENTVLWEDDSSF